MLAGTLKQSPETMVIGAGASPIGETGQMGKAFDQITDAMQQFIGHQHVFFVATAPQGDGHVNLSPKGYDSFRIIDEHQVAYLDYTGSGAETIAHLRQNGRITFMFCAFEGQPNIVRLYGTGRVLRPEDAEFGEFRSLFEAPQLARSIIVATIHRTSSSCGFSIPFMEFVGERDRLNDWTDARTADELTEYQARKNARSIDGLPAI